jgi:hypothetical protein
MFDDKDILMRKFEELIKERKYRKAHNFLSNLDKKEEKFLQNYNKRKKEGVYYTDYDLSKFIVEKTILIYINDKLKLNLKDLNQIIDLNYNKKQKIQKLLKELTICDPTCGSGNFLFNSAAILYNTLKKTLQENQNYNFKFQIMQNIYGFDINDLSIIFSKLKLINWFYNGNNFDNYSEVKSVINSKVLKKNSLINSNLSELNLKKDKFDIIIGNPPYGNILNQNEKRLLKREGIYFKDIYCAYLLKALEICDDFIGFLIPKSFLMRQSYINFRNELLSKADLLYIFDLGSNIFKNATNEVQILIYKKKFNTSEKSLKNLSNDLNIYNFPKENINSYKNQVFDHLRICLNYECPLNNRAKKFYVYTYEEHCPICFSKTTKLNRIRIRCTKEIFPIIKRIESIGDLNYLNVKKFPNLIRGEEADGLKMVKDILRKENIGECYFIDAKQDFYPYYFNKSHLFNLEIIDPKLLKGSSKEYYKGPKLLIKHNNIYPEALFTEEKTCFTSSIYSLLYKNKEELKYLCGLLNSVLIHFYCIFAINNQRDTTINLNQYMIRHLPILNAKDYDKRELATLVHFITQELIVNNGVMNKLIKDKIKKLNNRIFNLYSINSQEKKILISEVKKINQNFNLIY